MEAARQTEAARRTRRLRTQRQLVQQAREGVTAVVNRVTLGTRVRLSVDARKVTCS